MNRDNAQHLRSFWQIEIMGWGWFFIYDFLESIHDGQPNYLYHNDGERHFTHVALVAGTALDRK